MVDRSKANGTGPRHETSTDPIMGGGGEGRPPALPGISIVVYYRDGETVARLAPGEALVMGRREPSDLQIHDRTLSRTHARFSTVEGRVFVEDLGSRNGTWIAGKRVKQMTEIEMGGEVMLGTVVARVIALGAVDPALEGEERFRRLLDEEVTRAQQFRRSFAVLAVRAPGPETARRPIAGWAARLKTKLRPVDRVSPYTPDTALVLLPETDSTTASQLAREIASAADDGSGPHLVGAAVYREAASTAGELVDRAREAARQATPVQPVVFASTAPWEESEVAGDGEEMIAGDAMREVMERAKQVASARVPVILHGETGTGKEVLANYIHKHGPRRGKPMMRVNCGAIPPSLVGSTLFGHERGAFTGATQQQRGVFEAADKGILFLDEIGELPLDVQRVLLRVLETWTFSRVGSTHEMKVDVRVLAATHRDLEAMVKEGAFRQDLLYRLSGIELKLPPLRERPDEIEKHCARFLTQANRANGRSVRGIAKEAMALLRAYTWPGNVRELRNAVERAVVLARGAWIQVDDLPARVREARTEGNEEPVEGKTGEEERASSPGQLKKQVQQLEKQVLTKALQKADWNVSEAARRLGISATSLTRKMKALGLKRPKR